MNFERVIPMLRIFSLPKATEFYVEFLGFTVEWQHRFGDNLPVYLQLRRGDLIVHLTEHHGDCCPGTAVFIEMSGLAEFHAELTAKDYRYLKPAIEDAPWGARLMTILDPFGNRLLFNERNAAAARAAGGS